MCSASFASKIQLFNFTQKFTRFLRRDFFCKFLFCLRFVTAILQKKKAIGMENMKIWKCSPDSKPTHWPTCTDLPFDFVVLRVFFTFCATSTHFVCICRQIMLQTEEDKQRKKKAYKQQEISQCIPIETSQTILEKNARHCSDYRHPAHKYIIFMQNEIIKFSQPCFFSAQYFASCLLVVVVGVFWSDASDE